MDSYALTSYTVCNSSSGENTIHWVCSSDWNLEVLNGYGYQIESSGHIKKVRLLPIEEKLTELYHSGCLKHPDIGVKTFVLPLYGNIDYETSKWTHGRYSACYPYVSSDFAHVNNYSVLDQSVTAVLTQIIFRMGMIQKFVEKYSVFLECQDVGNTLLDL